MYPERISVLVFCSFNVFPILECRTIYLIMTRAQTPLAILYYAASSRNLTRALTTLVFFYYAAPYLNRALHSRAFERLQRSNSV